MPRLTDHGRQIVQDLAQRHGVSLDAAQHMLLAVLHGNGGMAQFNHPEFGGSGQWMSGGMTMVSDMFNNYLKGRVDSICNEIAGILQQQPGLLQTGSFQSQSQSGSGMQAQDAGNIRGESNLFAPDPDQNWWPRELGNPSATGSQNDMRYAYFANARRLAVKAGNSVWVYDTLNHQIGGFSQQQGLGGNITFTSQFGPISLGSLPVIMRDGQHATQSQEQPPQSHAPAAPRSASTAPPSEQTHAAADVAASLPSVDAKTARQSEVDILAAIEKLGDLKSKGILTEEEFAAKKRELLARL